PFHPAQGAWTRRFHRRGAAADLAAGLTAAAPARIGSACAATNGGGRACAALCVSAGHGGERVCPRDGGRLSDRGAGCAGYPAADREVGGARRGGEGGACDGENGIDSADPRTCRCGGISRDCAARRRVFAHVAAVFGPKRVVSANSRRFARTVPVPPFTAGHPRLIPCFGVPDGSRDEDEV